MLQTSALLPIAGRAAMMIRLPGWKPPVISSRSLKPDGVPVSEVPSSDSRCSLSSSSCEHLLDRAEVLLAVVAGDLEHRLLGLLDELARRRPVAEHALLDLVGALQQPPQQRVLAHDLRVAAGVAGGRHDAGQLVDRRAAADVLELADLAQAVGDRQHVDRLAVVVEREHRLVDQRRGARGRSPPARSPSSITSAYSERSDSRIAPSTDCSASRLCGGVITPRRGAGRAVGCRYGAHRSARV